MARVEFFYKRGGRSKLVTPQQALVLQRAGLGTYQTTDMGHKPVIAPVLAPVQLGDGYDLMTLEQLHALAKERGLKVHGSSGADKVRAALRA